ncbi:hypothetical protein DFH08DRAFT_964573 [Mycena albidolilacea]|uniref:Uncharacterized protein n=1 Tax=Mycena albidolilacea TaxID=1033008 RepID=A0AAD6ZTA5_9AGAR|nr:hypothetical protein DFH08DRAFT_964573 [Mycena albidolilacea]
MSAPAPKWCKKRGWPHLHIVYVSPHHQLLIALDNAPLYIVVVFLPQPRIAIVIILSLLHPRSLRQRVHNGDPRPLLPPRNLWGTLHFSCVRGNIPVHGLLLESVGNHPLSGCLVHTACSHQHCLCPLHPSIRLKFQRDWDPTEFLL